jgi:DMSO reductase anchor subunit
MKERSLVTFTLLAQTAVGAFLALLLIVLLISFETDLSSARHLTRLPLMWVGLLVLAGLLASFLHLGTPGHAWYALSNLRNSWLSREILFMMLFAGSGALLTGVWVLSNASYALPALLSAPVAASGLALIYSMARVYMLRTVPAWKSTRTLASFGISTLLLGALFIFTCLSWSDAGLSVQMDLSGPEIFRQSLGLLGGIALLALLIDFILLAPACFGAQADSTGDRTCLNGVRLHLWLDGAAVVVMVFHAVVGNRAGWVGGPALAVIVLCLALAGQILGRVAFYESRRARL